MAPSEPVASSAEEWRKRRLPPDGQSLPESREKSDPSPKIARPIDDKALQIK